MVYSRWAVTMMFFVLLLIFANPSFSQEPFVVTHQTDLEDVVGDMTVGLIEIQIANQTGESVSNITFSVDSPQTRVIDRGRLQAGSLTQNGIKSVSTHYTDNSPIAVGTIIVWRVEYNTPTGEKRIVFINDSSDPIQVFNILKIFSYVDL